MFKTRLRLKRANEANSLLVLQMNDLIKQLGNRVGMNNPTAWTVLRRVEALQQLAVDRDCIRELLGAVDPGVSELVDYHRVLQDVIDIVG